MFELSKGHCVMESNAKSTEALKRSIRQLKRLKPETHIKTILMAPHIDAGMEAVVHNEYGGAHVYKMNRRNLLREFPQLIIIEPQWNRCYRKITIYKKINGKHVYEYKINDDKITRISRSITANDKAGEYSYYEYPESIHHSGASIKELEEHIA